MRLYSLLLLSMASFSLSADWLSGLTAYENKDFARAKTEFSQLLPLGNGKAAFNLGVMAYYGEGQTPDLVKALSYFLLASEFKHPQADDILTRLQKEANPEQRRQAQELAQQAQQAVVIKKDFKPYRFTHEHPPAGLSTPLPNIPDDVHRRHPFGYIVLRYLVDGDGRVQVVDTVDAFPEGAFDSYTFRAMRRWQYEATGKQHLMTTQINFWVRGVMTGRQANQLLNHQNLWDYAQAGAPRYQEMLGSVLNLIDIVADGLLVIDSQLPLEQKAPDLTELFRQQQLRFLLPSFVGSAEVQTNDKGEIIRVIPGRLLQSPSAEELIGERIRGAKAGWYSLSRATRRDTATVQHYLPMSNAMNPWYWWNEAAINGDRRAQRILGAKREDWQFYLLRLQDPVATAWHGARLILDGETAEGQALLQQAAAAGYSQANELLQALLPQNI